MLPTANNKTTSFVPDVDTVAEETSARDANRMLRAGWRLLQVIHARDEAGNYPIYVIGRLRTVTNRV